MSAADNSAMVSKFAHAERHASSEGTDCLAEELGLGIKCCEVALSSASAATLDRKIKDAQRHLKTLLDELK